MTIFQRTNSDNTDFRSLVVLLDADLAVRDGEEHSFYAQFNKIQQLQHVVVCFVNDEPVGCGAFKPFEEDKVEVKRMFVMPQLRGRGIGLQVLQELERWAVELGYKACVLETGKKQPEAISLYTKAGYHIIPNYGQYANVENSVCMMKQLNKG
jgi:putative acetyltransferase